MLAGDVGDTIAPPAADLMLPEIASHLAIAVLDDAGAIQRWSPGCEVLYGWTSADAVGANKYDLLRSSLPDGSTATSMRPGSSARALEETCRDGRKVHVLEQAIPLAAAGLHTICMMQDSARDADWADDGRRIAMAAEMNALGTFGYHLSTQRLDWSRHCWRSLGLEDGAVPVDKLIDGSLGGPAATLVDACRDAIRAGSDDVERDLSLSDARLGNRTLRLRAQLMRDEDGKVDRLVGVIQDQTDPEIREQTLRDREAELSVILATVSDAMIVVDGRGIVGAFSRAARQLLGYEGSSVIGRPIDRLVEGGWPEIVAATVDGRPRELRMIVAGGDRIPVEMRLGSLPGGSSRHVLSFTDISARKASERRRSVFERTARDVAIAEFAAHLMHELNQPLAAAGNFLGVAQQLPPGPTAATEIDGMIGMALCQIQRVGGIIRCMHQKAAGEDVDPRSIWVRAAIEEAVTLVQIARSDGGVAIAVDVHPEAERMFVDPVGIQQILANLLRNAIEAFGPVPPDDARIEVKSRRKGDRLVLSIGDNGPGIAPALMPDLFEPFGRRDAKGGMGLGLSICRTIAEAHGGTLTAGNLPEGGACFTLALPLDARDGGA